LQVCALVLGGWFGLAMAAGAGQEDGSPRGPWVSLFNGRDLAGWQPVHEVNCLVTNQHLRLVGGMGWLRTEKPFADFVLELEWRALAPGYDSGLFLRAGREGHPWPKDAWQVNLKDNSLGALVKGTKTVVPAETPRKPVGQWVTFRLEARGRTLTLDVDGERAWEFDKLDTDEGYLGIQAENRPFEFRNLRIQELPRGGGPTPPGPAPGGQTP